MFEIITGKRHGRDHRSETLQSARRKPRKGFFALAIVALLAAAVVAVPQVALADGDEEGSWTSDEIEFQPPQPVEGRRVFVERLSVSGDRAAVTLWAATDLDIRVRAFGGDEGNSLRYWGSAILSEGERIDYSLPLDGPTPSFTVSWEDTLGQAGAVTVDSEQIPYPLPEVEGELCDLRVTSLGWTPGVVAGVIESACVSTIEHEVELQTVAGHVDVTETALMDAEVTAITGTVTAVTGASQSSVALVPNGETRFRLPVESGETVHAVTIGTRLQADLSIAIPPLIRLTHREAWTQVLTRTVSLSCGQGQSVSRTVRMYVHHPERIEADVVERSPITRTRTESLTLTSSIGADDPYRILTLPEPEPEPERGKQTPAEGLRGWFERLGWEWLW